jgi:hypothetical protein
MKTKLHSSFCILHFSSAVLIAGLLVALLLNAQPPSAASPTTKPSEPIPLARLGAVAGKQYEGDGLSVAATREGARLRCVFQRLEGQVTPEGLWLTSTAQGATGERFRVVAVAVGRQEGGRASPRAQTSSGKVREPGLAGTLALPGAGTVEVAEGLARLVRPNLVEEYSVSVDGVRQDFVVGEKPGGEGALRVELEVAGAQAEPLVKGARLVLVGSGRKLAYS